MDTNNSHTEVRFNESDFLSLRRQTAQNKSSFFVQWIINHSGGYVRTRQQANIVLIVVSVLLLFLSFTFLRAGTGSDQETSFAPAADAPVTEVIPANF